MGVQKAVHGPPLGQVQKFARVEFRSGPGGEEGDTGLTAYMTEFVMDLVWGHDRVRVRGD
jgi:hypothetical protein